MSFICLLLLFWVTTVTEISVSFLFPTLTATGDCYKRGSLHSIALQQQGETLTLALTLILTLILILILTLTLTLILTPTLALTQGELLGLWCLLLVLLSDWGCTVMRLFIKAWVLGSHLRTGLYEQLISRGCTLWPLMNNSYAALLMLGVWGLCEGYCFDVWGGTVTIARAPLLNLILFIMYTHH